MIESSTRHQLSFIYIIMLFAASATNAPPRTTSKYPIDLHEASDERVIDFTKSTEDNYGNTNSPDADAPIVGKYSFLRKLLDYNYHKPYIVERQKLHDVLIDEAGGTVIYDRSKDKVCEKPAEGNWIVFTAGAFGSGKSHVLNWLDHRGLFPLHSFVVVDPDHLREKLPETQEYIRRDASTAGFMTQKEVGYISEVIILKALLEGKNVIVDGSLKDYEWYSQYMLQLRNTFPQLKLAIIHVMTSLDTAVKRAARRGGETGRVVPVDAIEEQLLTIPQSLQRLKSCVDYQCTFRNDDVPELVYSSHGATALSSFQEVWEMSCHDTDEDTDVCPDNLITWTQNNYYRLVFSPPHDYCKLKSSL